MRKFIFICVFIPNILFLFGSCITIFAGEPLEPPSRYPSVRSVLAVVCAGEGLLDSGKYSPDQQKLLFNRNYKDRTYLISGKISDVGTTAFTGSKYITVMVNTGHYFDVFPSSDFDLLDYNKGSYVSFVGKWTLFGSGIMVHHKIEDAEQLAPRPIATGTEGQGKVLGKVPIKPSTSEFPELPPIASNPKPNTSWPAYIGVTNNKKMTIYDAISKTSGLETSIEKLSGQKADDVWERLSGPQSPITVESGDAIFGSACMAHFCNTDKIVIYIRVNGAIAIAFTDSNSGSKKGAVPRLYYFANFNSSMGIPKPVRTFIADIMKTTPGLQLVGVETINGITQIPKN